MQYPLPFDPPLSPHNAVRLPFDPGALVPAVTWGTLARATDVCLARDNHEAALLYMVWSRALARFRAGDRGPFLALARGFCLRYPQSY
jgi:hypothetical protein